MNYYKIIIENTDNGTIETHNNHIKFRYDYYDPSIKNSFKVLYSYIKEPNVYTNNVPDVIEYLNDLGQLHNIENPAYIRNNGNNKYYEAYYNNGTITNTELIQGIHQPASISWYNYGNISSKRWFVDGKLKRLDGDNPSVIEFHENGNKALEEWRIDNILDRDNGPASINYHKNGKPSCERFYNNGNKYRVVEYLEDGRKKYEGWLEDGKWIEKYYV